MSDDIRELLNKLDARLTALENKLDLHADNMFIREKGLLTIVPISRTSLWRYVKDGRFPAPVKLGDGTKVWRKVDLDEWSKDPENYGNKS